LTGKKFDSLFNGTNIHIKPSDFEKEDGEEVAFENLFLNPI